jgi:hypothetical protein
MEQMKVEQNCIKQNMKVIIKKQEFRGCHSGDYKKRYLPVCDAV